MITSRSSSILSITHSGLLSLASALCILMSGCDANLKVQTAHVSTPPEESVGEGDPEQSDGTGKQQKLANACLDPDLSKVSSSVTLTLCNGEEAHGLLDLSALKSENIRAGVSIAGVAGAVIPSPAPCNSDGAIDCVANNSFKAADMNAAVAANIKSGAMVAGTAGNYSGANPTCTTDGEMNCLVTGSAFRAADMSVALAGNIKSGAIIAGIPGNYGPGCTTDGDTACLVDGSSYKAAKLSNFSTTDIKTGVTIAGIAGSAVIESHSNCALDGATGCIATNSYKAVDMGQIVAGNIKNGVTVAGIIGTYPSLRNSSGKCDGNSGSCELIGKYKRRQLRIF